MMLSTENCFQRNIFQVDFAAIHLLSRAFHATFNARSLSQTQNAATIKPAKKNENGININKSEIPKALKIVGQQICSLQQVYTMCVCECACVSGRCVWQLL